MAGQNQKDINAGFAAQLETFRRCDAQRENLIKELVKIVESFESENRDLKDDLQSEKLSRRSRQNEVVALTTEVETMRQEIDRNGFVLALIDGDGAIFQDRFLNAGADGGSPAGHTLFQEIKEELKKQHGASAGAWPIMAQIYCNFDGLSRKLAQVGTLKSSNEFAAFAREFNLSQPLFNLIDVGSGKERADHKIKELFRLYVSNPQCKQLIFGGCHDNGYLPNLENYRLDQNVAKRLILLETTSAEKGYRQLGYSMCNFPLTFRSEALPMSRYNASATSFIPQPNSPQSAIARPSAAATSMSAGGSYATAGGSIEAKEFSIAPSKSPPETRFILLNKNDQRIDTELPRIDTQAYQSLADRIKRQKICNNYHLAGFCTNGKNCGFDHGERLTGKELIALRLKVRGLCCSAGSACRSFDCFLGHHCPRNGSCGSEECYFNGLHNVDLTPALKLTEDERVYRL